MLQAAYTCIRNNVDEAHTNCTPSAYYVSNIVFYLYALNLSFVHVRFNTGVCVRGKENSECLALPTVPPNLLQ